MFCQIKKKKKVSVCALIYSLNRQWHRPQSRRQQNLKDGNRKRFTNSRSTSAGRRICGCRLHNEVLRLSQCRRAPSATLVTILLVPVCRMCADAFCFSKCVSCCNFSRLQLALVFGRCRLPTTGVPTITNRLSVVARRQLTAAPAAAAAAEQITIDGRGVL